MIIDMHYHLDERMEKIDRLMDQMEKFNIDLSSPYLDEPLRIAAMKAMGPEKCLYGTDGPFGYPSEADGGYDHGAILAAIDRLPISSKQKEGIWGENFAALAQI